MISNDSSSSTWIGSWGDTWSLTSSYGTVSGTVIVSHPAPGCPDVTFTVTGSIIPSYQMDGTQGYTSFTLVANPPNPHVVCGNYESIQATYTGRVQNNGNDTAPSSSWTSASGSGTTSLTKSPYDLPISETTRAVGFSAGLFATQGQFRQTLNAGSPDTFKDLFKGRQVSEFTGITGLHYDNCWFQGSLVPKFTDVNGSLWNVGYYAVYPPFINSLNEWGDDYVGWNLEQVRYYRGHSSNCGARIPQAMYIGVAFGGSTPYSLGYIEADIYQDRVTVSRNGVSQTTTAQ